MSENATPIRILAALPPGHLLQACFDVLRGDGNQVEVAGDQEQAIHRVRALDWDLILVDFALAPDWSLGLLAALKAHRPATLVVMAGTGVPPATVRDAFRRGAHDVLLE